MEIKPNILNNILEQLRKQAVEKQTGLIIEARILINPQETRLLDVRPAFPLAIIHY